MDTHKVDRRTIIPYKSYIWYILEGRLVDKFDMCWNVNLKQSNESSKS
jgi:hypothetical protein